MLKGTLFSLAASLLFGAMYYLSTFLRPLAGEDIFGVRMVITLPFLFLTLFLLRQQRDFVAFLHRLKREPHLLLVLVFTAALVGFQMWLFLYAPNAGKAIEVSFGYLLLPIMLVAVGKLIYKETLSPLKWAAIGLAAVGVISNIVLAGRFSWEAVTVFVSYPLYFAVRRKFEMSHIHSFILEIILLIPIALYFISSIDIEWVAEQNPNIGIFVLLLGLFSGTALISYTLASAMLPFNLLGLLGYVEPCLMLIISFVIGEVLSTDAYILMFCLMLAILCLILDGISVLRKKQRLGGSNA